MSFAGQALGTACSRLAGSEHGTPSPPLGCPELSRHRPQWPQPLRNLPWREGREGEERLGEIKNVLGGAVTMWDGRGFPGGTLEMMSPGRGLKGSRVRGREAGLWRGDEVELCLVSKSVGGRGGGQCRGEAVRRRRPEPA